MPVLFRDFETRSTLNLADVGPWRYAADPSTEVLCIAYAVDDGPIKIWMLGQPIPKAFKTAARNPKWTVVAHNDQFETAIEKRLLHERYDWPLTPIERHRCTMAACLASALPGSLETAAEALGLSTQKDAEGHRLMMQMGKPRRPRKGEGRNVIHWFDDPERRRRLEAYCARDVEIEREIYKRVPPLSADEQALWEFDSIVNERGFRVDLQLAQAARAIVVMEQTVIDQEVTKLTDGRVTTVNQVAKLQALLQERGHRITSLTKKSVSAVLARAPPDDIRQLLELRREGSRAAPRKLDSLIAGIDADQRLRGTLRFHGASTGRWSGSRFQPQNLKKPQSKDLDSAIDAIRDRDLARVRKLGAPLAIAGDLSRSMICAAPGHILIGADFSAIESRVLAWLAGEQWKIDAYRKYDETGDPALEPYCQTASRILRRTVTPDDEADRAIGKTCDLAFGYGGGLGAYRRFDGTTTYSDAQVQNFKATWRHTHGATVQFWRALESLLRRAIRSGQRVVFKNLSAEFDGGNLYLTLPSGRRLTYPEAHLEPGQFGPQIVYKDNAKGGWNDQRGWHGIFVENVVAGIARDLLAGAMLRLQAAGFPIVLHVHDEAVAEVPEGFGSTKEFLRLMTTLPEWATGLPIVAKAWTGTRYAKSQTPSRPAPAPQSSISTDSVECSRLLVPEHIRKKYYPLIKPHSATDIVAFRAGSYTVKLCKDCAEPHFSESYPGGLWWTKVGSCAVCGVTVYVNPGLLLHFKRHPSQTPLVCSSKCSRKPQHSRTAIRAEQEAALRAEQEAIEAQRKERQRLDALIEKAWPETEAYQHKSRVESPTNERQKPLNGHAVASAIITAESEFAHIPLPALIGQPLHNGKIVCPFHDDRRPSLHVYHDHFHCYVCGAHGDHVDWLMMLENMNRAAALDHLAKWDGPIVLREQDNGRTLAQALEIWEASQTIFDSATAIHYLQDVRRIDVDALPDDNAALRFHPKCPIGTRGGKLPCLIACYRDLESNAFAGIHQILLTDDVLFAGAKVKRFTLGRWATPRAIKLWPAEEHLFVGEGVETVLAAATRLDYFNAPMLPAWATGSSGNLKKFPLIPGVGKIILLVDYDNEGEASANACRSRWRDAGRQVVRLRPEIPGTDFNDLVLQQYAGTP